MKKYLSILLTIPLLGCQNVKKTVQQNQNPNIILIMADDLGYETLGVYGGNSYKTPNLDKLAAGGMRFEHCYAMPLCTPSRVQLMTGKYNDRNYIGFGLLDPNEKTFGHYMQQAGYKTYIAGKWQLLGSPRQQELAGNKIGTLPEQAGFDDYCLWQIDQFGSRYKDPVLSIKGEGTRKFEGEYGPDIFVDRINSFMRENKDNPFFVYYPMALTHDPFVPTPDNENFQDFNSKSRINDPKYFGDMVSYMDKLVGRIVSEIETLGITDNTLILFIGDNGTDHDVTSVVNNTELTGDKGRTTDAGTHVPFIASWQGKIKKGSVNPNLVDFTDFLPSIVEAATHAELPEEKTDGLSFYPQLLGKNTVTRDWIFCHYDPNWNGFEPRTYVQDTIWKLYGNGELYNIENDKLEQNPLKPDNQTPEVQQIVGKFRAVLAKHQ
ncbi:sulfatase-like hydrolase/transferase [Flagellimonas oceanensis]|uniref:sulfatase-like hydrolase/transferase n=1 Tax=Flagellimonas oceanensis TaxID=2499163 RepID=UPI000F8D4AD8|nr:sulfatase-like hydrolase/transferase [Allomuricauda oceanensis]